MNLKHLQIGDVISDFRYEAGGASGTVDSKNGLFVVISVIGDGLTPLRAKKLIFRDNAWVYDPNGLEVDVYKDTVRSYDQEPKFRYKMKKHSVWFTAIPDSEATEYVVYSFNIALCTLNEKERPDLAIVEATAKLEEVKRISETFGNLTKFRKARFVLALEDANTHVIKRKWAWIHDTETWSRTEGMLGTNLPLME